MHQNAAPRTRGLPASPPVRPPDVWAVIDCRAVGETSADSLRKAIEHLQSEGHEVVVPDLFAKANGTLSIRDMARGARPPRGEIVTRIFGGNYKARTSLLSQSTSHRFLTAGELLTLPRHHDTFKVMAHEKERYEAAGSEVRIGDQTFTLTLRVRGRKPKKDGKYIVELGLVPLSEAVQAVQLVLRY